MSVDTTSTQIGSLSQFKYSLDGTTFNNVGLAIAVKPPELEVGKVEVPLLSATWKIKKPTIPDAGTTTISIAANTADPARIAFRGFVNAPTVVYGKVVYPDGGYQVFQCFITKVAPSELKQEDLLVEDYTFENTGAVVETPHT